jgi:hypothetical protein
MSIKEFRHVNSSNFFKQHTDHPNSSSERFYRIESLTHIDRLLGHFFPWNRLGRNLIVQTIKP